MELTLWQTSRTLRARAIHLTLLTGLIVGCSGSGPKKEAAEPPPPATGRITRRHDHARALASDE